MSISPQIQLQLDLASAVIALIALLFSIWVWRRQSRMEIEVLRVQRDNDVIRWSNEIIDVMSKIETLLRGGLHGPDRKRFIELRDEHLAMLSSGIDKGRLYFPNVEHEQYGLDKEAAYRGHRQAILDWIVEVYDLLKDLDPEQVSAFGPAREELIKKKRAFVSEAQSQVEPRRRVFFLHSRHLRRAG
jgi:hypothetical protein